MKRTQSFARNAERRYKITKSKVKFHFERSIMKKIVMALVLFVIALSFGCGGPTYDERWAHEEKMAQIKAQSVKDAYNVGMSEKDKAQLADMVADRVVEKMKQK